VTGYLDEFKSAREKALEELEEEVGISRGVIERVRVGRVFKLERRERVLFIYPVLVELKEKPEIRLN